MHWEVTLVFALVGLLYVVISIPLILGKVPPNPWMGFRTKKTLSDSGIWYKANAYSSKLMAIAGVVTIVASLVFGVIPMTEDAYAIVMVAVSTVTIVAVVVMSLMYIRDL